MLTAALGACRNGHAVSTARHTNVVNLSELPRRFWRRRSCMNCCQFVTLLGVAVVAMCLCVAAAAQEGYYGVGHGKWHENFYSKLRRNDGGGSCCNVMDCRPTQSRMVDGHYEVKVDGVWTPVPSDKINDVAAPDGGAHVRSRTERQEQGNSILCHSAAAGLTRME
jgi:hypothetical protein